MSSAGCSGGITSFSRNRSRALILRFPGCTRTSLFDEEAGWYRLYDDGSRFGTRICRDTRIIEVPGGSEGGAWLCRREEVHVGRARMEVDISGD